MKTLSKWFLTAALIAVGATALAADIKVDGSTVRYPSVVKSKVNDKEVLMLLTGTALRSKFYFNVYAIGSYVQEGVKVTSPEALAEADCAKHLHLVMERTVGGKEMADAFVAAIKMNYPGDKFATEIATLSATMKDLTAEKGDHIWLTHLPGVGLQCNLVGKKNFTIKNVGFSKAVWEIYLGQKNLGDAIKDGLVSRL